MSKGKLAVLSLLVVLLVGLLAACGGAEQVAATATPASLLTPDELHVKPVTGSDYAEGVLVADLTDDQIKVTTMMTIDWAYIEDLQKGNPFHQYEATMAWRETFPGGDVTINTVQLNEHTTVLAAQVAGGESTDIIPGNNGTYPLWPSKGLTADMNVYASFLDLYNADIYDQGLMAQYVWQGQQAWAVMTSAPGRMYLAYNQKKFDDAGEKSPMEYYQEGKWNWTQFVKTAKAMTTEGSYGFTGWGLSISGSLYPMITLNDDGTAQLHIKDPDYIRYTTELYNFFQKENAARTDWDLQNWATLLPMNTDVMAFSNLSTFEKMVRTAERKGTGAEMRLAPLPVFDPNNEETPVIPVDTWGYCISAAARNGIGAAEYIRLEALVMLSIEAEDEAEGTYLDAYLTDDEKALIEWVDTLPTAVDHTSGMGDCWNIIDQNFSYDFYYSTVDRSMQAMLDSIEPLLAAEVDAYNESLKKDTE